ncbi:phosphatase PAP2 family protein [Nocardioides sp. BP30]|uniref:phosphatase PAP2 family protein n=1 Tax=Nocardioides sp. BP30 TaxID=3036374 RepID=UPI0024688384|nr:phosphatase PAP2 family protein [Nocardioides sp. BP30]WGL51489.1 phosphatase PAP2 family protein [Nocardioides sp. BP30]
MNLDLRLLDWIAAHRTDALTDLARTMMAGGGSRALGVGLIVVFVLGLAVDQVGAVWIAIAAGGTASAIATALKALVDRPRPPADLALVSTTGTSMPSTIAALTAGAALALLLGLRWRSPRMRRLAAAVLGFVVVVVGAAMVYLGAHWLSDVLAGWALGAGVAVAFGVPFARLRSRGG